MRTGELKCLYYLEILNAAQNTTFSTDEHQVQLEKMFVFKSIVLIRLTPSQKSKLKMRFRSKERSVIRSSYLDEMRLFRIETPILTRCNARRRSWLFGTEPHLTRQFRGLTSTHFSCFQTVVDGFGFDRYYQNVLNVSADEDLRADRQPRITQVDIETGYSSVWRAKHGMTEKNMNCCLF